MNTENATLRRVLIPVPEDADVSPGDFAWDFDNEEVFGKTRSSASHFIYICLPGTKRMCAIEVKRGAPGGHRVWGWDGNEDSPTLTPSIHAVGNWHGYLTAGILKSC